MSFIKIQGEKEKKRGIYYQVDSDQHPIGTGGMGQVFEGLCVNEQNGSTRPVAIKFLYSDLPPHAIERARREASIQLRNDNLVEMLGFIEIDEYRPAGDVAKHYHVVSELLTGVSLSDIFEGKTKDRNGNDIPFAVKMLQDYRNDPAHFARTVVIGVLSGLIALHDAHYIHRDIDPSNIMLTDDGHIKLIDFGIAKKMDTLTTNDKSLTVSGVFMGKPEYAAPELALGDIRHQNQTTDIYAVGILLYQCIVGHTPFEGPLHEVLESQIKRKLPLSVIKDKGLRKIIATACEKKQELRYQSAAQMRVALEELSGTKRALPPMYKYGAVAAIVALVLGLGITFAMIRHKQQVAMKEMAEQQEILHQRQELERVSTQVHKLMARAEVALTEGMNYDKDFYENDLMQAYLRYEEALKIASPVDSILADTIAYKANLAMAELDSAVARFRGQQREAVALNLQDSTLYRSKAETIEQFIKEHSNLKEAVQ